MKLRRVMKGVAVALVALAFACSIKADPDKGRFSCVTAGDCGTGYDCVAQVKGASLCFKAGTCNAPEVCNGADDNCNGAVDETFPETGEACTTGKPGRCAAGTRVCVSGGLDCTPTTMPSTEACNGLDDDCDGQTDEDFDVRQDSLNCGRCGFQCVVGTACVGGVCHESACFDQFDNDGNGKSDCDDDNCYTQRCSFPTAAEANCGYVRPIDGGSGDAGAVDAGAGDAGVADAGTDAGGLDAGAVDAGESDAGDTDAGAPADAGADDAGTDGGVMPPPPQPPKDGGYVVGCFAPESQCANGYDDDGDGQTDCADVNCAGRPCNTTGGVCASGACTGP